MGACSSAQGGRYSIDINAETHSHKSNTHFNPNSNNSNSNSKPSTPNSKPTPHNPNNSHHPPGTRLDMISTPNHRKSSLLRTHSSFRGNMVANFYTVEINSKYSISKKILGSGASSEVVLVTHKSTDVKYALKSFDIRKKGEKQVSEQHFCNFLR